MRIVVHGQQAFGKSVLEALLDRGDDVVAVYCAPDAGGRSDPLKEYALHLGFEVNQPASWADPVELEKFRSHNADLCVMAYVTAYVPEEVLNAPVMGSIQYHPSLLPMHRGPSSINWSIINGETNTGLTIFWPDSGLDTGPVLLQKDVAIGPDDTAGSVYFNSLYPMGVDAILESIDRIESGRAPKDPQDPAAGSYEGWCRQKDAEIDWYKPATTVYNLIRGCNPQPGAWTMIAGRKVTIYDSALAGSMAVEPGQITDISGEGGITIAADKGSIMVMQVKVDEEDKITALQYAERTGLKVGDRVGSKPSES
ncbi:hypothetical protein AB833_23775 [Chromatiales bacterium (ex Bugula neritina AB1)]|nr:hypothetical protein AB833_23775 [Chromatiales bacterium (ex Bugula neritina AB1)]